MLGEILNVGKSTMAVKVLQLSDPHYFADPQRELYGINSNQTFSLVVEAILAQRQTFDFIAVTGDLIHDDTQQAYERLKHDLGVFGVPCYVIPGNHDAPMLMRQAFHSDTMRCDAVLERGNWQFLFLDSCNEGQVAGRLAEAAYETLQRRLDQCAKPTAIFVHHPPLPVGSKWLDKLGLADAERFLNLIRRYPQVKAVVNGHVHQEFSLQDEHGIWFLGTPSTCAQFKPQEDNFATDDARPGWRVFEFFDDGSFITQVGRV